jgi:hypothetical protein
LAEPCRAQKLTKDDVSIAKVVSEILMEPPYCLSFGLFIAKNYTEVVKEWQFVSKTLKWDEDRNSEHNKKLAKLMDWDLSFILKKCCSFNDFDMYQLGPLAGSK